MLRMKLLGLRSWECIQRLDSESNTTGWKWSGLPRGYRLLALIASLVLVSALTITGADSAFSSWGVEGNTGWQLISNGHYTTRVLIGAKTDQSGGTAFITSGHTLVVDYKVSVKNGSAFINVFNNWNLSQDSLYYHSIEQDEQGHLELPINHTSLYAIDVSYYSYAGNIDVRWHVD